ncbi:MAG: hypothetical protein J7641_12725 [Cyanobacteria bacterium SID2]|nr:hypothetical protein [Cyanobacteria bacterium SID2]MBP0002334.1 hypothetical protein [Cyanobacteria bacterium SBC]
MSDNPYLKLQRENSTRENPYLQAAKDREEDARIMVHLSRLVPNSSTSQPLTSGCYQSAIDSIQTPPKPRSTPASLPNFKSKSSAYRSPEDVLREEENRKRQERDRLRREEQEKQRLQQEREQQEIRERHQLEERAKAFLKQLDKLDSLDSDRMWFDAFAQLCSSRLEAAIEFVKTVR